jgi:hypothetical protein
MGEEEVVIGLWALFESRKYIGYVKPKELMILLSLSKEDDDDIC